MAGWEPQDVLTALRNARLLRVVALYLGASFAVLEAVDLISDKVGRQRQLYFNPVPIQLIYERWTDEYSALWASHVSALKHRIEGRLED